MRSRSRRVLNVLVGLAGALCSAVSVGHAQITLLPSSTADGSGSALGIGPTGTVVGQSSTTANGPFIASVWSGASVTLLPGLTGAPAGSSQFSSAFAINASGVAVGSAPWAESGPGGQYASKAAKWQGGVATDLGKLPGFRLGRATAINASGQIVGGCAGVFAGDPEAAVRWSSAGVIQELGKLADHTSAFAYGINDSGRAVGHSNVIDGDFVTSQSPVYWDDTTPTALALPAGSNLGDARSINNAGRIAGQLTSFDPDNFTYDSVQAAYWPSASAAPVLLPLLPGTIASNSTKVNARGDILGTCFTTTDSAFFRYDFDGVPVLWTNGQAIDLGALLAPSFPERTMFSVYDLNDNGQICGTAFTPNGLQAFVATVPAPSGVTLLATAGVLCARGRRRGIAGVAAKVSRSG